MTLNTCGIAGLIVRISAVASPAGSKFELLYERIHVGEEERDVMMSEPPWNSKLTSTHTCTFRVGYAHT